MTASRIFLICLVVSGEILMCAVVAHAGTRAETTAFHESFITAGVSARMEQASNNQTSEIRDTPTLVLGHEMDHLGVLFEARQLHRSDGNAYVKVTSDELQLFTGLTYAPWPSLDNALDPYVVAGVGVYQVRVLTEFNHSEIQTYGDWNTFARVGLGTWWRLTNHWRLGAEIRVDESANFNPVMMPGAILSAGVTL